MEQVQRALDAGGMVGEEGGPYAVSYTSRDLLLYSLGIGSTADLRYLYEGAAGFAAFPTFPLVLPYKGRSSDIVPFPGRTLFLIPRGLRDVVDPGDILHYDQSLRIFEPLDPAGAELEGWSVVLGLYRKRGGVLLRTKTTLTDTSKGRTMAETTQGTFMRGLKILGDAGPPLPPRPPSPTGPPDVVAAVTVSAQQALLYRLSGDYNPIHVDPDAARAAGLEKPILHGLCSLGIAAVQVTRCFCPEDPSGLAFLSCRFSRTVFPTDVLEVKMWRDRTDTGRAPSQLQHRQQQEEEEGEEVRFEVCSLRQGGAVVVADGRAVLKRPRSARRVATGGGERPSNRARL
eukprot:g12250.t1